MGKVKVTVERIDGVEEFKKEWVMEGVIICGIIKDSETRIDTVSALIGNVPDEAALSLAYGAVHALQQAQSEGIIASSTLRVVDRVDDSDGNDDDDLMNRRKKM